MAPHYRLLVSLDERRYAALFGAELPQELPVYPKVVRRYVEPYALWDVGDGVLLQPDWQRRPTVIATLEQAPGQAVASIGIQQFSTLLRALDEQSGRLASQQPPPGGAGADTSRLVTYHVAAGWNRTKTFHAKAMVPAEPYLSFVGLDPAADLATYEYRRSHDHMWVDRVQPPLANAAQPGSCAACANSEGTPLLPAHPDWFALPEEHQLPAAAEVSVGLLGSRHSPVVSVLQRRATGGDRFFELWEPQALHAALLAIEQAADSKEWVPAWHNGKLGMTFIIVPCFDGQPARRNERPWLPSGAGAYTRGRGSSRGDGPGTSKW